jgi:hypothetical protein
MLAKINMATMVTVTSTDEIDEIMVNMVAKETFVTTANIVAE